VPRLYHVRLYFRVRRDQTIDERGTRKGQRVLLFPLDRDTHEFFCRLQSNVFDAASLFQTNHVVHQNAPREDIFSVWRHDFFVLRDVHSQRVYLQEESLTCRMRLKKNRAEFVLTIF